MLIPLRWEIAVAAIRSGIVICPATTLLVEKDIEFRCLQTSATVFIGDSTSVNKFLKVQENCPEIKHVIQVDTKIPSSPTIDFFAVLSKIPEDTVYENSNIAPSDPSLIYFTSGTSGPPKMVQHNQISYPLGKSPMPCSCDLRLIVRSSHAHWKTLAPVVAGKTILEPLGARFVVSNPFHHRILTFIRMGKGCMVIFRHLELRSKPFHPR